MNRFTCMCVCVCVCVNNFFSFYPLGLPAKTFAPTALTPATAFLQIFAKLYVGINSTFFYPYKYVLLDATFATYARENPSRLITLCWSAVSWRAARYISRLICMTNIRRCYGCGLMDWYFPRNAYRVTNHRRSAFSITPVLKVIVHMDTKFA